VQVTFPPGCTDSLIMSLVVRSSFPVVGFFSITISTLGLRPQFFTEEQETMNRARIRVIVIRI